MTATRRLRISAGDQSLAKQPGELVRFRVFQGPDAGAVFVVTRLLASIGRGEENDIVLTDLKTSRKHAELVGTSGAAGIEWSIKDCGSANGILHNGASTRAAKLRMGDTVSLGETTLELADAAAAPKGETQFKLERAVLAQQVQKAQAFMAPGRAPGLASSRLAGVSAKKSPLLLLVGGIAVGYILMFDTPTKKPAGSEGERASATEALPSRDLASFLPPSTAESSVGSNAAAREAETFFRSGFREYRERNLLRARSQFETALQIQPTHRLAILYLKNVETRIREEVKFSIENAARKREAGKLREARTYYATVLRLLYREPKDPDFEVAKEKLDEIDAEISKAKGGDNS